MENNGQSRSQDALGLEWVTLQNNIERYENGGLALKLIALGLTVLGLGLNFPLLLISAVVLLIWLQEGIYRTFQARLGQRIVQVEAVVRQLGLTDVDTPPSAFQLHSEWLANRPGGLGLIREYLASAVRPTVAYPYAVVLLGLMALPMMVQGR